MPRPKGMKERYRKERWASVEALSREELISEVRILRLRNESLKKGINLLLDLNMRRDGIGVQDKAVQGDKSHRGKRRGKAAD